MKTALIAMFLCSTAPTSSLRFVHVTYSEEAMALSTETSPFRRLGGFDFAKVLDCPDGYVYYSHEVFSTNFTEHSDLYLAHFVTVFTPSVVARQNGNTYYEEDYLDEGYVHITLERYIENSYMHGGEISVKNYWPKSTTFQSTVTSSFGRAFTVGSSFSAGVDIGNGASLKGTNSGSLTLTFDVSRSTVMDDPVLSTQISPENPLEIQFSYNAVNSPVAGSASYTLDSYILFEMNDDFENANRDAFIATYEVQFKNSYRVMFDWYAQGEEHSSAVRISEFL